VKIKFIGVFMKKFLIGIVLFFIAGISFSQEYHKFLGQTKEQITESDTIKKAVSVTEDDTLITATFYVSNNNFISVVFSFSDGECNGLAIAGNKNDLTVANIYRYYLTDAVQTTQLLDNNKLMQVCLPKKDDKLYVVVYTPDTDQLIVTTPEQLHLQKK
jgi:hypothetical protein